MAGLNDATNRSRTRNKSAQFDFLGSIGQGSEELVFQNMLTDAERICGEFVARVQNDIPPESFVTGEMAASLSFKVTKDEIAIYGSPYLMYQNSGVQGTIDKSKATNSPFSYTDKKPPVEAFATWIREKNIVLRNETKMGGTASPFSSLNNERLILNAAWAMSVKVFREGFKGSFFLSKNVPFLLESLDDILDNFVMEMVDIKIDTKLGNKMRGSRLGQ